MGPGNLSQIEMQALDAVIKMSRTLERIADSLEKLTALGNCDSHDGLHRFNDSCIGWWDS